MADPLATEFHDAMLDVYRRAKDEAGYTASIFLRMLNEQGGLETARYLLHASKPSDGYTALWERKRLDLTVEEVILEPKWRPLFTDGERANRPRERGAPGSAAHRRGHRGARRVDSRRAAAGATRHARDASVGR